MTPVGVMVFITELRGAVSMPLIIKFVVVDVIDTGSNVMLDVPVTELA